MSASQKKSYDSTVARIAGNILSRAFMASDFQTIASNKSNAVLRETVQGAVIVARAIVAEVDGR